MKRQMYNNHLLMSSNISLIFPAKVNLAPFSCPLNALKIISIFQIGEIEPVKQMFSGSDNFFE